VCVRACVCVCVFVCVCHPLAMHARLSTLNEMQCQEVMQGQRRVSEQGTERGFQVHTLCTSMYLATQRSRQFPSPLASASSWYDGATHFSMHDDVSLWAEMGGRHGGARGRVRHAQRTCSPCAKFHFHGHELKERCSARQLLQSRHFPPRQS
jgi:hypothetical protein